MPLTISQEPANDDMKTLFERIFPDIQAIVRKVCVNLGRDPDRMDVNEFAQRIGVLLLKDDYRLLRSFKHESSLETWLFTITKRDILRWLREQGGIEGLEDKTPDSFVVQQDQEERLLLKERRQMTISIQRGLTMINLTRSIAVVSVLALISGVTFAQKVESQKTSSSPDQVKRKGGEKSMATSDKLSPSQQQALQLIDSLSDQIKYVGSDILKIKIQARITDAIWRYDEPRARNQFINAFQAIDTIKVPDDQDTRLQNPQGRSLGELQSILRQEVLRLIAPHDLQLADTLRQTINQRQGDQKSESQSSSQEEPAEQDIQLLQLAIFLAKDNPAQAGKIVRESLRKGINEALVYVMVGIRHEKPELADELFQEALSVARSASITSSEVMQRLALYVLPDPDETLLGRDPYSDPSRVSITQMFLMYACDFVSARSVLENSATPPVNDPTTKEMAEHEYETWQMLMPLFTRMAPNKVPVAQARLAWLASKLSGAKLSAIETPSGLKYVAELLRKAEASTDGRVKDMLYLRAAMNAFRQDDINQAFSIVDRISIAGDRETIKSLIMYQASLKAHYKEDVDGAIRYAKNISFLPQRVGMFNRIAQAFLAKKDYARATEIIDEIWQWAESKDNSPDKAGALLSIVAVASGYDTGKGFEALQSAVRAINDADFTPPKETPLSERPLLGKILITAEMLDYEHSFRPLARTDFERTLLAAQILSNKEAALLAKVAICQEALKEPSKNYTQSDKKETKEDQLQKPAVTSDKTTEKPAKPRN